MGAYAECWVGNLIVTTSRNGVDESIMDLFRATDRVVRRSTDRDLPEYVRERWREEYDDPYEIICYEASIATVRDRLDLEGYTLENARRIFELWRRLDIRQRESWEPNRNADAQAKREAEIQGLRDLTIEQWIADMQRIYSGQSRSDERTSHKGTFRADPFEGGGWYGYDGPDPLVAIRLALEVCPPDARFIYDVTDLVLSEYLHIDEDPIELAIDSLTTDYHEIGRTIVLTEGRSDMWIVRDSMSFLYPHLAGYFSFMDFAEFRVGGGAGQLANLVKAFAAAGIVNRVIAIFDNDAAATAALVALRKMQLPKHIIPMQLPSLDLLRRYPTLGPTGSTEMDVNGMAGSIELYLGQDALRDPSGVLPPIQWTGFEPSVQRYQGELLAKVEVQTRFREKLARAREDSDFAGGADWSSLRVIFERMFSLFHQLDGERLAANMRQYMGVQDEIDRD